MFVYVVRNKRIYYVIVLIFRFAEKDFFGRRSILPTLSLEFDRKTASVRKIGIEDCNRSPALPKHTMIQIRENSKLCLSRETDLISVRFLVLSEMRLNENQRSSCSIL